MEGEQESESLSMRREVRAESVPPPKEWKVSRSLEEENGEWGM